MHYIGINKKVKFIIHYAHSIFKGGCKEWKDMKHKQKGLTGIKNKKLIVLL